jgi:hypothetical protein
MSSVVIASGDYQVCPPRVVRGSVRHAAIASSPNHTVRLLHWRRLASYESQFVIWRRGFGKRWPRSALALNGMRRRPGNKEGGSPYPSPLRVEKT